jgi:glycosyltransferase involved in cell wall biosynthesis
MTKKWPKISIITPSFNQVDFIERTIKSVVEQDYSHLEYIIKDAGSEDGSVAIIKDYAHRYSKIIKWISEKDKGQTDGINQGLRMAKGKILAYLNSDDTLTPGALKKVALFFQKNPKTMWLTGRCQIVDEDDKKIRSWIAAYKNFWLRWYHHQTLLILNYISQPATFWRREALEKIGYFDIHKHYAFDYDYWLRLGRKYSPGIIWQPLANFRVHRTSKGKTGFFEQFREDLEVARRYTNNSILIIFHRLSNFVIIASYSSMTFLERVFSALRGK